MRYQDRVPRGPFIKPPAMRVVADWYAEERRKAPPCGQIAAWMSFCRSARSAAPFGAAKAPLSVRPRTIGKLFVFVHNDFMNNPG